MLEPIQHICGREGTRSNQGPPPGTACPAIDNMLGCGVLELVDVAEPYWRAQRCEFQCAIFDELVEEDYRNGQRSAVSDRQTYLRTRRNQLVCDACPPRISSRVHRAT